MIENYPVIMGLLIQHSGRRAEAGITDLMELITGYRFIESCNLYGERVLVLF